MDYPGWIPTFPHEDAPASSGFPLSAVFSQKTRANTSYVKLLRNLIGTCTHCVTMITHDHDHIRLPRLDTDQLASSVRMRSLQVWKDFSAPMCKRPEHNVRCLFLQWLLQDTLGLPGDWAQILSWFFWPLDRFSELNYYNETGHISVCALPHANPTWDESWNSMKYRNVSIPRGEMIHFYQRYEAVSWYISPNMDIWKSEHQDIIESNIWKHKIMHLLMQPWRRPWSNCVHQRASVVYLNTEWFKWSGNQWRSRFQKCSSNWITTNLCFN